MAVKKIQMKPPENNYADILHPETDSDVVLMPDGSTLTTQMLKTMQALTVSIGGGSLIDPDTTAEPLILTGHANKPAGSSSFVYVQTMFYSAISNTSNRAQIALDYSSTKAGMWIRKCSSNTWTPWEKVSVQSDYVRQPGYVLVTGAANAYEATLDPAPTALVAGMCIAIKINVANTGASTLNVNGLGAKSILRNSGSVPSGYLKVGYIYTVRYSGSSFILQGEGGSGNATASDLLSGKTASTDAGDITGTMPNMGGTQRLAINAWTDANVGRLYMKPNQGYYDGAYSVYRDDPNFIPANIKTGVPIFGLTGSLAVGTKTASGVAQAPTGTWSSNEYWDGAGLGSMFAHKLTVTGLNFKPTRVMIVPYHTLNSGSITIYNPDIATAGLPQGKILVRYSGVSTSYIFTESTTLKATADGFILPVENDSLNYAWFASE